MHFFGGFAQADHEAGLRQSFRAILFGEAQHRKRLPVIGLRANAPVEARHGLHVVVEDVRTGVEDARDRVEIAAKIRGQHFDAGLGKSGPDFANGLGEMLRTAIRQIVAIHRSNDDVTKIHVRRHFSDMARFVRIEREIVLRDGTLGNRAETAAARAQIAKNHECRSAAMKAFVNIRAARRFADRVQPAAAQLALQRVKGFEVRTSLSQPAWKRG